MSNLWFVWFGRYLHIQTEFCGRGNLHSQMTQGRVFEQATLMAICRQMALALEYMFFFFSALLSLGVKSDKKNYCLFCYATVSHEYRVYVHFMISFMSNTRKCPQ